MININLLPESMRKREGMPRNQLLALVVCLGLAGGLIYAITRYTLVIIPDLNRAKSNLTNQKRQFQEKADELKRINAEITRMSGYVDAVKGLYKQRVVWAKILSDLKNIVNFDKSMSEYNSDQRYLWLTEITAKGKELNLQGFATASSQVIAMQMPERILQGLRDFSPVSLPEKDEEERLEQELGRAITAHENERREFPNLPLQGNDELKIRARLEEIKAVKSGGIALLPFGELFVPGSLQLRSTAWVNAPKPRVSASEIAELFPDNAWNFTINMTLK